MELDAVRLGSTGLQVGELAFGTARFGNEREDETLETDRSTAYKLLDRYTAAGGKFLDMADVYGGDGDETYVGD